LDLYQNHLYVSLSLHSLVDQVPKSDDERHEDSDEMNRTSCRKDLLTINHREDSRYLETHRLLRKQKLHVTVEPVSIFLLENRKFYLQINSNLSIWFNYCTNLLLFLKIIRCSYYHIPV
jgi:hypothetical protein